MTRRRRVEFFKLCYTVICDSRPQPRRVGSLDKPGDPARTLKTKAGRAMPLMEAAHVGIDPVGDVLS